LLFYHRWHNVLKLFRILKVYLLLFGFWESMDRYCKFKVEYNYCKEDKYEG